MNLNLFCDCGTGFVVVKSLTTGNAQEGTTLADSLADYQKTMDAYQNIRASPNGELVTEL
jgi:hypothetical protein